MARQQLPPIGLGTFQNTYEDECVETVKTALDIGYRHVDTAQDYGTEDSVGRAIRESPVDRDDLFVATKIWNSNLSHEDVLSTFDESLDRLGMDYVDLLYIHWPAGAYDPEATLSAFERLYDEGRIQHIGVSNFTPELLDQAREILDAPIYANQVEMHPYLQQRELREYCDRHDIEVVAYSPLMRGRIVDVPELRDVADRYDATAAQVALAWIRQKGATPIPMAIVERYLRENYESVELELDESDVEVIDDIDTERRVIDPEYAPW